MAEPIHEQAEPTHRIAEPIYRLNGIGYRYGNDQVALDGIDLEIHAGERLAILGANGSGKSTLLKLLDGIIGPSQGTMTAMGRDVAAVAAGEDAFQFHREVGLVFQDPDIQLFSATVLDDVAFGPLQLGLPKAEVAERCDEALGAMAIAHLADRAPFELSGGEKKRAAIASVLSLRPSVLLLDEPTAALDPRTKWVLVDLIARLGAAGRTLITATHELDIVPLIARRVIVLGEDRRIMGDGSPAEILADRDLLIRANLIHEHLHEHGSIRHSHPHPADEAHGAPVMTAEGIESEATEHDTADHDTADHGAADHDAADHDAADHDAADHDRTAYEAIDRQGNQHEGNERHGFDAAAGDSGAPD